MDTLIWKMTQYTRLLCLLVCFAVQDLSLAEIGEWDDSGLSGSNMGLRILKRDNGQVARFLKRDANLLRILNKSNPPMNMVNNKKKSKLCTIFINFQDDILLSSTGYGDAVYKPEDGETVEQEGPLFVAKNWYPGFPVYRQNFQK